MKELDREKSFYKLENHFDPLHYLLAISGVSDRAGTLAPPHGKQCQMVDHEPVTDGKVPRMWSEVALVYQHASMIHVTDFGR